MHLPRSRQFLFGLALGALLAPSAGAGQELHSTPDQLAKVARISLEEFKKRLAANEIIVLDVRGPQSYLQGHIPGALSVPLATVEGRVAEFKDSKKPIVTYCA